MRISHGIAAVMVLFMMGCFENKQTPAKDMAIEGEEEAKLTSAPEVPPPITRKYATKVVVKLEVVEKQMQLSDGVKYTFWTFGGTVPGKFIRIREGDMVEFHLSNHPDSKMPHNIDLHAVTGPGGGAAASFTAPGHTSTFSFRALNPGLYVYHCATAPVGMHIANGMYGLIFVEPRDGLEKVDREYYIFQSEFYTKGKYGEQGSQPFSMDKALREEPDYVVFNGSVGALTGDKAINTKVGETVRLFVGNGGPNLISSFHVIGEIFDKVYTEGGTKPTEHVQTTIVPSGGSAIVEFKVDVPGSYILVDHSIFRAFNKGAIAMIKAEGSEDKLIYSGKQSDSIYLLEGGTVQNVGEVEKSVATTKEEQINLGRNTYKQNCAACHQAEGTGVPGAFPPLAKSDFLNADKVRAIGAVKNGLSGKITVNGQNYDGVMPMLSLADAQIANVLTFIYSSWGNAGHQVSPADVAKVKNTGGGGGEH